MIWISIKETSMPLEKDIIVKHSHGIDAIHFFNHKWTFWYSNKHCSEDFLKNITHWMLPS